MLQSLYILYHFIIISSAPKIIKLPTSKPRQYPTPVFTAKILIFDERDVKWIKDLTCLKKCGMSIQEMKIYLDLCLQGESTIPLRKEILMRKRETLMASIAELNECVAYVDWKQSFYDDVLSGKCPYISNLIRAEE